MKPFLAFGLAFAGAIGATSAMLAAPPHGGGAGTRTSTPGGSVAAHGPISHPLGGFSPTGSRNLRVVVKPAVSRVYPYGVYPYGYAWYVPSYAGWGDDSYYGAAPPTASDAPSTPQQPVVINQYFGAQEHFEAEPAPQAAPDDPPQTAGDPIGTPQNYYLIAYRNHAVYSALAYWVEDKTLHYVTTQNTHNQASLELIDLDLTKSLNQTRDLPFSIPGQ
jgi:hypothetical protein